MKIILSPTKKMKRDTDSLKPEALPVLLPKAEKILQYLRSLSPQQLQKLWGCNDSIAAENLDRLKNMNLTEGLTPAILAYEGIAFQYMAPTVFEDRHLQYVQDHLRILSGFYGILKPLDGITPYRLEMQAKAAADGCKDLYDFWGRQLYDQLGGGTILNLASKEYSQCISRYLRPEDRMVTCVFCEIQDGKQKQKATFAKMARGEMVRYLSEIQAQKPEDCQGFYRLNFHFRADLSTDKEYIFERIPEA